MLFFAGVSYDVKHIDYDYTKYLGPDYKDKQETKNIKLLISNHLGMYDAPMLNLVFGPSFCPTGGFKTVPVFGRILQCINCIFMPRGTSEEIKQQAVEAIVERVKQNEEEPSMPPLICFPEGGTGTGVGVITFKRGAFVAEKPIKPIFMKVYWSLTSGINSLSLTLGLNHLTFMHLSVGPHYVTLNVLPDFYPNEYLFENHKENYDAESNENQRWKSYAFALREIMVDAGQFDEEPYQVKDKMMYERFMAEFREDIVMDDEYKLKYVELGED